MHNQTATQTTHLKRDAVAGSTAVHSAPVAGSGVAARVALVINAASVLRARVKSLCAECCNPAEFDRALKAAGVDLIEDAGVEPGSPGRTIVGLKVDEIGDGLWNEPGRRLSPLRNIARNGDATVKAGGRA